MKKVTQGTLIYGMRCQKYPELTTYGFIISAACDLAQDKIDKVFHLIAIPLTEWMYSNAGFQVVTAAPLKNYKANILNNLEKYGVEWDIFQTLTPEEFEKVAADNGISKGDKKSILNQYEKYKCMAKEGQTFEEKLSVYESERKSVESFLGDLFNGGNSRFVFIPKQALSEKISVGIGLVIDLHELDYFPIDLVKRIADGEIDYRVLPPESIADYNKLFVLCENDGFAYPVGMVVPPWREYVLQHFSNCFIRIGVDNPGKQEISGIVDALFNKEEQP